MGSCFSKKKDSSCASVAAPTISTEQSVDPNKSQTSDKVLSEQETTKKEKEDDHQEEAEEEKRVVKKEIFVIKHRKSHDKRCLPQQNEGIDTEEETGNNINNVVRTSSCTKEEVDAILIQCGRLSRSNSTGNTRKYSGSKRSYDFDHIESSGTAVEKKSSDDDGQTAEKRQHRQRHRSSSQGRRRTPSRERERERDQQQLQHQRSGSRERGSSSGGGRRVSRSPGRRTESNTTTSTNRPGKMVSVPATVNVMDKSNNNVNAAAESGTAIKRISVKRNVASPRSQSPARTTNANVNVKTSNENHQHPSLSRNSSRKAEHSPYRRNPLSEIEPHNNRLQSRNIQGEGALVKDFSTNIIYQKPNVEIVAQGTNYKATNKDQHLISEDAPAEGQKPQSLTRSRSSRRSRDLDFNPETSYTALLLEDIQSFHQKNNPSFSLPPCVTKACSILEAVADLNSTTTSGLSEDQSNNKHTHNLSRVGKKMTEAKDPFVESEVHASDDLTEPSFHKYVTVRRGGALGGVDLDEEESSGSNSYAGGIQHNWSFSSSSWEPNSADSTDRWTSKEEDQRPAISETRKGLSGKKRDTDLHKAGIWRGRVGGTVPIVAAVAST